MKKIFYSLSLALAAFFMPQGVCAQNEPSAIFECHFDADLEGFTEECAEGQNIWGYYDVYQSALANGQDEKMRDSRLVSPAITCGTDNSVSLYLGLSNFSAPADEICLSVREVGGEWTDLQIEGIDNTWATFTVGIPAAFDNKNIQFAVRYHSSWGMILVDDVVFSAAGVELNKIDPALSFDETEFNYVMGEDFYAPYLNNEYEVPVTYSSSDESVATVDYMGNVYFNGAGVVTITAKSEETVDYYASEASYTVNVTIDENIARELFLETFIEGQGEFTTEGDDIWYWNVDYEAMSAETEAAANASLVSPAIELGKENTLSFMYYAFSFTDINSAISVAIREVGGEWVMLTLPELGEYAWNWAEFEIPAEFDDKTVEFKVTYDAAGGYFNICNFTVKGKKADVPTSIEGVETENMINGVYDIQGRKVENPVHGLYIINGKKVVLK